MRKTLLCVAVLLLGSPSMSSSGFISQFTHPELPDDAKVGAYISSERGFSTATFWIEAPDGLVLIDTQFLLSSAEEAIRVAEKSTGKKAVAAFVLHPNPDKFNGVEVFKKHGIRVLTSAAVLKRVSAVHELRKSWFFDRFKPDYPEKSPEIESLNEKIGESSRVMAIAGTDLILHFMGPGCSDAHLVIEWKGHLFVGDLVTNDYHSWLELGLVGDWLKRIKELQNLDPDWIHVGRGPSGDSSLLDQQLHYLKRVQQITKEVVTRSRDKRKAQVEIKAEILKAFPGYRNSLFVSNGAEALVRNNWKKKP